MSSSWLIVLVICILAVSDCVDCDATTDESTIYSLVVPYSGAIFSPNNRITPTDFLPSVCENNVPKTPERIKFCSPEEIAKRAWPASTRLTTIENPTDVMFIFFADEPSLWFKRTNSLQVDLSSIALTLKVGNENPFVVPLRPVSTLTSTWNFSTRAFASDPSMRVLPITLRFSGVDGFALSMHDISTLTNTPLPFTIVSATASTTWTTTTTTPSP